MANGPNITAIAALIGDQARAAMLTALMSGEACTATELAAEANVTKQTASGHLAKLLEAGLVSAEREGRHRYFRLADRDVARLLENLMGVAERTGARRLRPGPKDPQLRKARVCYDHLAGDLGVRLYDSFLLKRWIEVEPQQGERPLVTLTKSGLAMCDSLGLDLTPAPTSRRPVCRACLDWSVRRHHLAGTVGDQLLEYCYSKRWAKREEGTRVVSFTARGERAFADTFRLQQQAS